MVFVRLKIWRFRFSVHLAPDPARRYRTIHKIASCTSTYGRCFLVLLGLFYGRLLPEKIVETVEGLHGLCLGGRYGVGVDVRRGAGLGMAQLLGYHHQGNAVGNHQRGVGVPQAMYGDLRHPGPGNKAAEPLRHKALPKYAEYR